MLKEKYTSKTSYILQIIPAGEIEMVIYRGQRTSEDCWWWGNRALLWIEVAMESGKALTKDDALAALSQVSGIPKRTLRYYAAHANWFSKEHQEKYEPLPFSHFAVAKRFGERWEEVLNASADYLENAGRLPSSEWLEWKFSRNAEPTMEADQELSLAAVATEEQFDALQAEVPLAEDEHATASYHTARRWISQMDIALTGMQKAIELLPISANAKTTLEIAINELREVFEDAIKEVSLQRPGEG